MPSSSGLGADIRMANPQKHLLNLGPPVAGKVTLTLTLSSLLGELRPRPHGGGATWNSDPALTSATPLYTCNNSWFPETRSVCYLQADWVGEDQLEIPGSGSESGAVPLHFDRPAAAVLPLVPLSGVVVAGVVGGRRLLSLERLVKRTIAHLGIQRGRHQHRESWKGKYRVVMDSRGEDKGKEDDQEAGHPHP